MVLSEECDGMLKFPSGYKFYLRVGFTSFLALRTKSRIPVNGSRQEGHKGYQSTENFPGNNSKAARGGHKLCFSRAIGSQRLEAEISTFMFVLAGSAKLVES